MHTRGSFVHLLRPGVRKDMRDEYMQHSEEYSRIVRVGNQDRAEVEALAISGLPRQVKREEAENVTYADAKLSDKVTYLDDEFALGFIVSRKAYEDDLYGKIRQQSKWLARSVRLSQEFLVGELLDDSFAGASFTGLAGEALFSTSHSILNASGTWSNQVAGNPQLGVTGLQAAHELAENTVDHTGNPIQVQLDTLVIGVADIWAAIQLTQNEMEPYTADNNINDLKRKQKMSYVVSHYKDQSANEWFARDTKMHDMHFLFRVRPQMHDAEDPDNYSAKYSARQRILAYFFDQRGWIGSNAA